jgi:urease subunit gamma/beta
MRLLPREQDRLLLFLAAELARRRRDRGLRLNQAEATALIADAVCEAARDGLGYAEVEAAGYRVLGPGDVIDGVGALVPRVEVEALLTDGMRLVVLHDPIARDAPPEPITRGPDWHEDATVRLTLVNEGALPIGLTSHVHLFEVNRDLRFDRAAAWGMRLAMPAGQKAVVPAGERLEVALRPIGGARIVRGHGGLVDGALDAPGALEAALALARERGYRGA